MDPIENVNVIGNTLLGATTCREIKVDHIVGANIRDNTLHSPENDYGGIYVTQTASYVLVDGNRVYSASTDGVFAYGDHIIVSNNYVSDAGSNGIYAHCAESQVIGNRVINSINRGIYVGGSNTIVTDNIVKNSGSAGIRIHDVYDVVVNNNICFDDQDTKTQTYGIEIAGSGCDRITVIGNNIVGNKSGGIYVVSGLNENGIVRDNIGFLTENSGTATITNGSTSIVVDHGLDVTPSAGDIMVTPMGSLGSASFFYIDTFTSTQFTIHTNVDPGTNVDFAWKAIVL